MYQKFLKQGNGDQNLLRCPDIQDNNFEVLCSKIILDKVDLECAGTVKDKPTGIIQVLLPTQHTINFSSEWLDNSGYLITQW